MKLKLLSLCAVIIAACIVMVLHEIPRIIVFFQMEKRKSLGKQLLRCHQFIDPIGLLFCVVGFCGFSKSYMIHVKKKETRLAIGIAGLISLLICFAAALLICKYVFPHVSFNTDVIYFLFMICQFISVLSIGMFIANLFPIASFDMGFIIGGVSEEKFISINYSDYYIKAIFILSVIPGLIRIMSTNGFLFLYRL